MQLKSVYAPKGTRLGFGREQRTVQEHNSKIIYYTFL